MEALLGPLLQTGSGTTVPTSDAFAGKKYVGIYFSGHWCPPCRHMTPELVQWYEDDAEELELEIVLASVDDDEAAFEEYFAEMPWLAIPYEDEAGRQPLNTHTAHAATLAMKDQFDVPGYPTLVIVNATTGAVSSKFVGEKTWSEKAEGVKLPVAMPHWQIAGAGTGPEAFPWGLKLEDYASEFGLVAILRGVTPDEVVGIGEELVSAGFKIIEVPLNSPEPFESISKLSEALGDKALIGAGTVINLEDVASVAAAGGRIIVMPHSDTAVIKAAKAAGMLCLPGVATPTEAFSALAAGADGLKLFPAEGNPPAVLKAMLAVLPKGVSFYPVGGITPDNMDEFRAVGAAGFGLGSALYKPGDSATVVAEKAAAFVAGWAASTPKL